MQPSDKDIDKIIKDAGDNYQATGATPDWAKMESLLDKHLPVKKKPKRKLLLLFLLLLLLAGTPYIYFIGNRKAGITAKKKNLPVPMFIRYPTGRQTVKLKMHWPTNLTIIRHHYYKMISQINISNIRFPKRIPGCEKGLRQIAGSVLTNLV